MKRSMQLKIRQIIIFTTVLLFAINLAVPAYAGINIQYILSTDGTYERILYDNSNSTYWIVNQSIGLTHLTFDGNGNPSTLTYPIGPVYDATGPDNLGRIYCSTFDGLETSVIVFDTLTFNVVDTFLLSDPYIFTGLTLSDDFTSLYVCAWTWPLPGQLYSYVDSEYNVDMGLVLKLDPATGFILDSVEVGTMPETIRYSSAGTGNLLVHSRQLGTLETGDTEVLARIASTYIIDTLTFDSAFPVCNGVYTYDPHIADLIKWDSQGLYVAQCEAYIHDFPSYPDYNDGIWIIDVLSGQLFDTLNVTDALGEPVNVLHAQVSLYNPNILYVVVNTPINPADDMLLEVNIATGQYISSVPMPYDVVPEFIHERTDGKIIITTADSGLLYIGQAQ